MNLIDESKFNFLWVTDWPLFEYDEEARRYLMLLTIHLQCQYEKTLSILIQILKKCVLKHMILS